MTTTFETAKVGDKVWSIEYGWGEIESIAHSYANPIMVKFRGDAYSSYRLDGSRYDEYTHQTLFWDEVKIEAPKKPLPDLVVDTKVLVWVDPLDKLRRHFSHFKDGRVHTFDYGYTSFSAKHISATTGWPHWEIIE